jgi:transcriptional adapter 2-alpha
MDLEFDIDPEVFHDRKRRRITEMNNQEPPPPKAAPTSQPGVHEVATFLPGRLEFEHEIDNEAEDLVKDLEFGTVLEYGGDQIIEDENDLDVRARAKWEEEKRSGICAPRDTPIPTGKGLPPINGKSNGYHINGEIKRLKSEDVSMGNGSVDDETGDEPTQPQPFETKDSLYFKLTLLEMYFQRVEKRLETKAVIFERGLLDYKKVYFLLSLPDRSLNDLCRCKRLKRNDRKMNASFFIACAPSQGYKRQRITKPLPPMFCVRFRRTF